MGACDTRVEANALIILAERGVRAYTGAHYTWLCVIHGILRW